MRRRPRPLNHDVLVALPKWLNRRPTHKWYSLCSRGYMTPEQYTAASLLLAYTDRRASWKDTYGTPSVRTVNEYLDDEPPIATHGLFKQWAEDRSAARRRKENEACQRLWVSQGSPSWLRVRSYSSQPSTLADDVERLTGRTRVGGRTVLAARIRQQRFYAMLMDGGSVQPNDPTWTGLAPDPTAVVSTRTSGTSLPPTSSTSGDTPTHEETNRGTDDEPFRGPREDIPF